MKKHWTAHKLNVTKNENMSTNDSVSLVLGGDKAETTVELWSGLSLNDSNWVCNSLITICSFLLSQIRLKNDNDNGLVVSFQYWDIWYNMIPIHACQSKGTVLQLWTLN